MRGSENALLSGGGFDEAAPRASYKLINAPLVWPLYHGDGCVGMSGVYAIINAIRLAIAHKRQLTGFEVDGLMRAALQFMAGRLTPDQAVLSGLRVSLWRQLVEATAERRYAGLAFG